MGQTGHKRSGPFLHGTRCNYLHTAVSGIYRFVFRLCLCVYAAFGIINDCDDGDDDESQRQIIIIIIIIRIISLFRKQKTDKKTV